MATFEHLEVWKLAQSLRRAISGLAKTFPEEERHRLEDQIIRHSRQVATTLAHGTGIEDDEKNAQLCREARGNLNATLDLLICAYDEDYISPDSYAKHRKMIENCMQALNEYLARLNKKVRGEE
ncbi:MAG: four helix bundle protein [Aliifodinibius sp.]|nr:four helix bundle protein [Fodinibius sp.]NIV10534.1 four helix bundle protein [Fodinibius sp.]NIY24145.1 four helix bundle protein [Fodinibius sp.]